MLRVGTVALRGQAMPKIRARITASDLLHKADAVVAPVPMFKPSESKVNKTCAPSDFQPHNLQS